MRIHFRTFFVLAALSVCLAACQAMTPGPLALKGKDNSGSVVATPTLSDKAGDDELNAASTDAPPNFPSAATPRSKASDDAAIGAPQPVTIPPPASGFDSKSDAPTASPSGSGSFKSPFGPFAKADEPMPPKADLDDPLTGGERKKDLRGYGCILTHISPSGFQVRAGVGWPYPPLAQPGLSTLQARFFAEILEAPADCLEASCWTQRPAQPGHHVQLVRYLKGVRHFQTAVITEIGADGANVEFSGPAIQDGDEIEFSHIPLSKLPFPSPTQTEMNDDAWSGSGTDCDFGWFTIKTAPTGPEPIIPYRGPRMIRQLQK